MTDKRLMAERPADVSEDVWDEFQALRKAKKSPFTRLALKGVQREAVKAKLTIAAALTLCIERGWQGFNAEWVTGPPEKEVKKGSGLRDFTPRGPQEGEGMPQALKNMVGGIGKW